MSKEDIAAPVCKRQLMRDHRLHNSFSFCEKEKISSFGKAFLSKKRFIVVYVCSGGMSKEDKAKSGFRLQASIDEKHLITQHFFFLRKVLRGLSKFTFDQVDFYHLC